MYVEVEEEYRKAQKLLRWRPFPLQSAINLNITQLKTPLTSTLPPQPESLLSDGTHTTIPKDPSTTSMLCQLKPGGGSASGGAVPHVLYVDEQHFPIDDRERAPAERPVDVTMDEAVSDHRHWVHAYASFSSSQIEPPTLRSNPFIGGRVSIESPIGVKCQRVINLAGIP